MIATARATGVGRAGGHHGEILQGVFEVNGALVRGLVTLPCPRFEAEAGVVLQPGPRVDVAPAWKLKARFAARMALDALGLEEMGARLIIRSATPVRRGFGSSTSDVVATIRAVCAAAGSELDEAGIAELAVLSETASDPLMFDGAVLFAQRDGVVLEDFGVPLPALAVVGFSTSPHEAGISTLDFPPARYTPSEAEEFEGLRLRLRDGLARGDVAALGRVATDSARLNQRHLPVPGLPRLIRIAHRAGAAGVQVAHSGDVAGLLFDPEEEAVGRRLERARTLLAGAGITTTWAFQTTRRWCATPAAEPA
jgi:uncharacterized protein involved in propanediol utilization